MNGAPWTPREDQMLRAMWRTENHSAAIIASVLGRTRNAIIGRAQRLGLSTIGPKRGRRKRVLIPRLEAPPRLPSKSTRRIAP